MLFFFCSDVAIRAIKSNSEGLLSTLTQWSLIFIKEQVSNSLINDQNDKTMERINPVSVSISQSAFITIEIGMRMGWEKWWMANCIAVWI